MSLACSLPASSVLVSARTGLVAVALGSFAAAAPQVWSDQVGTSAVDVLYGVAADGNGGSFECGAFNSDIGGPDLTRGDAFVTRRDALGNVLWTRLVATNGDDGGVAVASDSVGGVYLAGNQDGWTDIHWSNNYDAFVARFDASGNQLWLVEPGLADYEEVRACAADGTGGVFVAGITYRDKSAAVFQDGDPWMARIDASGGVTWLQQFGSAGPDFVAGVEADGTGGALMCGATSGALAGPLTGTFDGWFARFDAAGNLQTLQQFGLSGAQTSVYGIAPDGVGGLFLGGNEGSLPFVRRLDAQGSLVWHVTSGTDGTVSDLTADGQGGVYALGGTGTEYLGTNAGLYDPWIRRFDASGAVLQSTKFGSKGSDFCSDIELAGTGVIAGGFSIASGALFGPLSRKGWVARFEDCDFDSVTNYCTSSPNSSGKPALVGRFGSTRVSNNEFVLFTKDCPTFEFGVFLQANAQSSLPFGNGTLCVGGGVQRLGSVSTQAGFPMLALDMTDPSSPASQITPGSTWHFQLWFRDTAGGGAGFNLSNGLSATFCP